MSSAPGKSTATQSFYLNFRRWCLLNQSRALAAQRVHHGSIYHTASTQNYAVRVLIDSNSTTTSHPAGPNLDAVEEQGRAQPSRACRLERGYQMDGRAITPRLQTSTRRRQCSHLRASSFTTPRSCFNQRRGLSTEPPAHNRLADPMRQALRTLTKPCVLITSCAIRNDISTYSGVTLSSFDAVTLDPVPHISFNIRVPSRTYNVFEASKQICAHILSATPAGVTIADTFTKPYANSEEPFQLLKQAGASVHCASTSPQIQLEQGVISWLLCEKSNIKDVDVGDHKICTFVVKEILASSEVELHTAQGLAYGQRAFRSLGAQVEPMTLLKSSKASEYQSLPSSPASTSHSHQNASLTSRRAPSDNRASASFIQASGFHTSCRSAITLTEINLASFEESAGSTYDPDAFLKPPVQEDPQRVADDVLKQKVSDFLCHDNRSAHKFSRLRIARAEAEAASAQLKACMADGSLTLEESERLEGIVGANERFIARTLAHRTAHELRHMLDAGHVSPSRVQFMEKCIEKGHAALLHEAKDVAEGRQRQGFGLVGLGRNAHAFRKEEALYTTELMRLRDYYEDRDGDGDY